LGDRKRAGASALKGAISFALAIPALLFPWVSIALAGDLGAVLGAVVGVLAMGAFLGFALADWTQPGLREVAGAVGFGIALALLFAVGGYTGGPAGGAVAGVIAGVSLAVSSRDWREAMPVSVIAAVVLGFGYAVMLNMTSSMTPMRWLALTGVLTGAITGLLLGLASLSITRAAALMLVGTVAFGLGGYGGGFMMLVLVPAVGRIAAGVASFGVAGAIGGLVLTRASAACEGDKSLSGHTERSTLLALLIAAGLTLSGCGEPVEPWQPVARLGALAVQQIAYSPGGKLLAVAGCAGVRLYHGEDLREQGALAGHAGPVTCLAFDQDGTRLATGGDDRTVRLWDVPNRKQIAALGRHPGPVRGVAFIPEGRWVASAGSYRTLTLWDTTGRRPATVLRRFGSSKRRRRCRIALWNVARGRLIFTRGLYGIEGCLRSSPGERESSIAVNADGKWLASASALEIAGAAVAFSPTGRHMAWGGEESQVRLRDLVEGSQEKLNACTPRCFAFSPDGKWLASGHHDGVRLWDVASKSERAAFADGADAISVTFSPDGRWLASVGEDGALDLWDMRTRSRQPAYGDVGQVTSVVFSPDGQRLASASRDGCVRLWDVASQEQLASVEHANVRQRGAIYSVAFAPDSKCLASGGEGVIQLWNVAEGRATVTLNPGTGHAHSLAFSPDGRWLAATWIGEQKAQDGKAGKAVVRVAKAHCSVRLWEVATTKEIIVTSRQDGRLVSTQYGKRLGGPGLDKAIRLGNMASRTSVAFDPSGPLLAWGSPDGTIHLWDTTRQKPAFMLRVDAREVRALAFSRDGTRLASAGLDKTVRLWSMASRKQVAVLRAPRGLVVSMTLSPDGNWLALAPYTNDVCLWDLTTQKQPARLRDTLRFRGHTGSVNCVAFSPDGQWLASSEDCDWNPPHDHGVRLWDVPKKPGLWDIAGRKAAAVLRAHTLPVSSVAFSPDGKWLATGSKDGTVVLWTRRRKGDGGQERSVLTPPLAASTKTTGS